MCGVNASEGKLSSAVIIHKVGYKDAVAEIECADNIFLSIKYTASGVLMAIGESEALVISDNGANVNKIAYGGELVAFDINFDYGTVLYVSGVDDEGSVMLYDTRGDRRFAVPAPEYCVALSVTDNGCALLCRGELHFYRNNGTVSNTFETSAVSSDVQTFGGASYVLDGVKHNKYRRQQVKICIADNADTTTINTARCASGAARCSARARISLPTAPAKGAESRKIRGSSTPERGRHPSNG